MSDACPALTTEEFLDWLRSYGFEPTDVAHIEFDVAGVQNPQDHVHMRVEVYRNRRLPKKTMRVPLVGLPGSTGPGFTPRPTTPFTDDESAPRSLGIEIEANGIVVETTILDSYSLGELVATVARTTGLETIHPDTLTLVLRNAAGRELAQDTTAATARIVKGARLTLSAPDVPAVD